MSDDLNQLDNMTAEVEAQLAAAQAPDSSEGRIYRHDEYRWDRSQEKYWDLITYQLVGAVVVDGSIPILARTPGPRRANGNEGPAILPSVEIRQIEQNLTVHASTWWPGKPQIIEGVMADATGFYEEPGVKVFNTYRAPVIKQTDLAPDPWIDHVKLLWPQKVEHEYFFDYCAHMVQFPGDKCNAGIVLSGTQGIGKDAALIPLKVAVGFANAMNISPDTLFKDFNEYVKSVALIIDEARSQSDEHKATTMYNVLKPLCAAPPEVLRMNLKKLHPVWIRNCCRLFITTNEVDAMFIPKDDRRLFVMHCDLFRNETIDKMPAYWEWLKAGGGYAVANWLKQRDISKFDPAAEPPKTAKHAEIANSWGHDPDSTIAKVFDILRIGGPDGELPGVISAYKVKAAMEEFIKDPGPTLDAEKTVRLALSPRNFKKTMNRAGYVGVANPDRNHGRWECNEIIDGRAERHNTEIYRRDNVPIKTAHAEAAKMLRAELPLVIAARKLRAEAAEKVAAASTKKADLKLAK